MKSQNYLRENMINYKRNEYIDVPKDAQYIKHWRKYMGIPFNKRDTYVLATSLATIDNIPVYSAKLKVSQINLITNKKDFVTNLFRFIAVNNIMNAQKIQDKKETLNVGVVKFIQGHNQYVLPMTKLVDVLLSNYKKEYGMQADTKLINDMVEFKEQINKHHWKKSIEILAVD